MHNTISHEQILIYLRQTEFEETILEDLALLDIHSETVTHTSDYFDQLYELALQMIKTGKAYADDTEQLQAWLN